MSVSRKGGFELPVLRLGAILLGVSAAITTQLWAAPAVTAVPSEVQSPPVEPQYVTNRQAAQSRLQPHRRRKKADRSLRLVDLTGAFDQIWVATSDLPDDRRVKEFDARFARVLPGFYSAERVKDFMTPEQFREHVLKGLKSYPEHRDGIRRISQEFGSLVAPAQKEFESAFGPMRGYPPVYLVNSLGEFDGGTRDLPEGTRLMFGADMIDRLYKTTPVKPFVEHELFHLLHQRTFPECKTVWCNLWEEGLATYVASVLNPGASDAALVLTFPVPLRPAVEAHRTEAVCAVRARLNSRSSKDYAPLFAGGGPQVSPNLPTRFAYYVGLLVVQDAGRNRNPKQLAALRPEEARALVAETLARMAKCPPARGSAKAAAFGTNPLGVAA